MEIMVTEEENLDNEPQLSCLKSQENFIRDLIKLYKENRILWDKNHPKYKIRDERDAAFNSLLVKANEYFPEVNLDFVKMKIDSIRGTFRREHKKVLESKKKAKNDEDIYVPGLWYYNHLLFLVGEDVDGEIEVNTDVKSMYSWPKHHTIILIELLKKYPALYSFESSSNGNKAKRTQAYREITNELVSEVGRNFEVYEVKNKINTLKQQFRRECKDRGTKQKKCSRLWCYDLLMFLKDTSLLKKQVSSNNDEDISDDTEHVWSDLEADSDDDKKHQQMYEDQNEDDIFDTIGKNVAIKLRDMTDEQRIYAENLINEIMYHGLMENLIADSKINFTRD